MLRYRLLVIFVLLVGITFTVVSFFIVAHIGDDGKIDWLFLSIPILTLFYGVVVAPRDIEGLEKHLELETIRTSRA